MKINMPKGVALPAVPLPAGASAAAPKGTGLPDLAAIAKRSIEAAREPATAGTYDGSGEWDKWDKKVPEEEARNGKMAGRVMLNGALMQFAHMNVMGEAAGGLVESAPVPQAEEAAELVRLGFAVAGIVPFGAAVIGTSVAISLANPGDDREAWDETLELISEVSSKTHD